MENEADFSGLPSTQMVEMQLRRRASQIFAPADLLPAIGRLDEAKRHFIEVGEIYYHYIFQNRGEEISRHTSEKLDDLLYWVFRDVTFEMATTSSAKDFAPGVDIRQPIFRMQKELIAQMKTSWAERLTLEIDEVLTRNPFKIKGTGPRKLSLRNTSPHLPRPANEPTDSAMDI